ncbi:MAG TPA: TlpA disulfide reductase family protein [Aeromicrobium sp.]|nr:TlpA disulfide reductase family protein [Aeromicrobium sp.]
MRIASAAVGLVLLLGACGNSSPTPRVVDPPAGADSAGSTPTPSAALPDLCPPTHTATKPGAHALPDVTLNCLGSDERRNLRMLGGRPLVLNFWASWCGPCKVELPLLARAHREHGDAIAFVGIDVQDASAEAWKTLIASGVDYPQLEDPRGVTRGVFGWNGGLPMTVFVDAQGRMVATERTSFRTYSEVTDALSRHLGTSPKDVDR